MAIDKSLLAEDVDRNGQWRQLCSMPWASSSSRRTWIETLVGEARTPRRSVVLPAEDVDRNSPAKYPEWVQPIVLPRRSQIEIQTVVHLAIRHQLPLAIECPFDGAAQK